MHASYISLYVHTLTMNQALTHYHKISTKAQIFPAAVFYYLHLHAELIIYLSDSYHIGIVCYHREQILDCNLI